jgi:hypothetical protein
VITTLSFRGAPPGANPESSHVNCLHVSGFRIAASRRPE